MEEIENEYQRMLAEIQAEEDEEEKPKPKRGRKKKEEAIEEESIGIDAESIQEWIALPFDIYFSRNGKEKLSNIEKIALSQSTSKVLNKYIPVISEKWKEEIGLGICLATIFLARSKPPEVKEETKQEEKSNEEVQQ